MKKLRDKRLDLRISESEKIRLFSLTDRLNARIPDRVSNNDVVMLAIESLIRQLNRSMDLSVPEEAEYDSWIDTLPLPIESEKEDNREEILALSHTESNTRLHLEDLEGMLFRKGETVYLEEHARTRTIRITGSAADQWYPINPYQARTLLSRYNSLSFISTGIRSYVFHV